MTEDEAIDEAYDKGFAAGRAKALEEAAAIALDYGEHYGVAWRPATIMIAQAIRDLSDKRSYSGRRR